MSYPPGEWLAVSALYALTFLQNTSVCALMYNSLRKSIVNSVFHSLFPANSTDSICFRYKLASLSNIYLFTVLNFIFGTEIDGGIWQTHVISKSFQNI